MRYSCTANAMLERFRYPSARNILRLVVTSSIQAFVLIEWDELLLWSKLIARCYTSQFDSHF